MDLPPVGIWHRARNGPRSILNRNLIRYGFKISIRMESPPRHTCLQCNSRIDPPTFQRSIKKYKFPLCEDCQIWFLGKIFHTAPETLQLYFALRSKGIDARLERQNRYKRTDIAIQSRNLHIEINSAHQHHNALEALEELRTHTNVSEAGKTLLRIPGSLLKFHIEQTSYIIQQIVTAKQ
jgi:hypothetical protein